MASAREIAIRRLRKQRLPALLLELLPRGEWEDELMLDRRSAAERRAEALLYEQLTDDQYTQLCEHGYVEIQSGCVSGRRYRIPRNGGRPVVFEGGRPVAHLCVGTIDPLPIADVILSHLVLILADEARYLAIANRFPIGSLQDL